jgi:hydroxymethylpyrimidine/phosphomethylpyrimidine kinase
MGSPPVILSVAGYDPSSGAGITADVKTAAAMGCYAVTCATSMTVQTTQGVFRLVPMHPEVVRETLDRLAEDVEIAAVRIGMLGTGAVAKVVGEFFRRCPHRNLVLDPIIRSSSGMPLIDPDGPAVIRNSLLPLCDVVTPNVEEAAELTGIGGGWAADSECWTETLLHLRKLAGKLHDLGCRAAVITGGHLSEPNDYLSVRGANRTEEQVLPGTRLDSTSTHGTGCAFATALACGLAHGRKLPDAVRDAKEYVRRAIAASYPIGKGSGPMNHLFRLEG